MYNKAFSHVTTAFYTNAGDIILSNCVRNIFTKKFNVTKWLLVPIQRPINAFAVDKINETEKLIIGGGGLFLPSTNTNNISGWQWAVPEDLLRKITASIIVYSVGYSYFKGQEPTELFKNNLAVLVEKSAFFGLRNHGSIEAVRALIPDELKSKVVYQPCITTLINRLANMPPKPQDFRNNIAVNIAFDKPEMRYGDKMDDILRQIAAAVKIISKKGCKIFYVCHIEGDKDFVPYLRRENVPFSLVKLYLSSAKDIVGFYNQMGMTIGMRGHSLMIPFGLNCEILSLDSHDKTRWFLEDIDALDWNINLRGNIDSLAEEIINKFEIIHEKNYSEIKNRLVSQQEKLLKITKDNLDIIAKLS